jgi:hypothetical protein
LDFVCDCGCGVVSFCCWVCEIVSTSDREGCLCHDCCSVGYHNGTSADLPRWADVKVLATICLFPVDIALVSTTVDRTAGLRKPWASPERVAGIVFSLKVVYYSTIPLTKER